MKNKFKELFYPTKNVKILIIISCCLYIIVAFLSIAPKIARNIVSSNYDYYQDNVLYDEFSYNEEVYSISNVNNMLQQNALKYANILDNKLKGYGCSTCMTLKVHNDGIASYEFYFTDYFDLAFSKNSSCSVDVNVISKEKGIFLTEFLYKKFNYPEQLTVSLDESNSKIDIPVVGVYEIEEGDQTLESRIYCDYEYIKIFEENNVKYGFHYSIDGIYIFENNIDKVIDGTFSKYEYVEDEEMNLLVFFNMVDSYYLVNIIIFYIILVIIIVEKIIKTSDVRKTFLIFYKNKIKLFLKFCFNDIILQLVSFVLTTILLLLFMVIYNSKFQEVIYPSYDYLLNLLIVVVITVLCHLTLFIINQKKLN